MAKHTVVLMREKETKNAVRFAEVPEAGKPPIINTLYIQKWVAGEARRVTVQIELE